MNRRALRTAAATAVLAVSSACVAPGRLPPAHVSTGAQPVMIPASTATRMKLISLNVAHSRSTGIHQLFQGGGKARAHLDAIADLIERERADVVALQEVDGASVWSGGFDHVEYLADSVDFTHRVRGTHTRAPGLDYGTALIARIPMDEALSVGFRRMFTPTRKGFVVSRVRWPGHLTFEVDLVSVHLDPMRPKARAKQAEQMIAALRHRSRPLILMGDFNSDWHDENSAVRLIGEALRLAPHPVKCTEVCFTHARTRRYVDWILVTPELSFEDYRILDDKVSDHLAISATVALADRSLN